MQASVNAPLRSRASFPHPFAAAHLKPVAYSHNRFVIPRQDNDAARESQMAALAKIKP